MPAQQILLPLLRTYVIAMWIELLTLVFCQLLRDALSASSYLVGVDADDPGSIDCNCNCLEDSIPSAPPSISIPFLLPHEKGHASSNAIHIEQLLAGILVLHQVLVESVFRRKSEQILSQLRQSALLHQRKFVRSTIVNETVPATVASIQSALGPGKSSFHHKWIRTATATHCVNLHLEPAKKFVRSMIMH